MTKYIELKGGTIQTLAEDPGIYPTGTWASGGNLNTHKGEPGTTVTGIQTSAINFFGSTTSGGEYTLTENVETYNGSTWTEVADINTVRWGGGGAGISSTSALGFGGYAPETTPNRTTFTESWNGTAWTEVADLNLGRNDTRGCGIQTAALCAGGYSGPPNRRADETETWNGSAWSEVADLNTARNSMGVFGTTSAAIAAGGSTPSVVASTESWNGTAWTETNDLNTARIDMGTAGNHDEGIVFGGTPPGYLAITESWNGFTWTEQADLATGRYSLGGAGSGSAALAVGGGSATDTNTAATEEWTVPSAPLAQLGQVWFNEASTTLKGFAAQGTGTWAAGGAINTARLYLAGAGTSQYASMIFGGAVPGTQDITETYNGTAWTEVADLNTAREQFAGLSAGSITATATVGGVSSASSWKPR